MCWYRPCPNDRCFIAMITVRSRVVAFLQKLLAQRVTGKNAKVRCRRLALIEHSCPLLSVRKQTRAISSGGLGSQRAPTYG